MQRLKVQNVIEIFADFDGNMSLRGLSIVSVSSGVFKEPR